MAEVGTDGLISPISDSGAGKNCGERTVPQVEGYEILGELGEGGMGTVWSAVQLSTRRQVALKLLGKGAFSSEKARARFEREVELTGRLEHPNVARIYDSGLHQGVHYYAMEFIGGAPLDKYVEEHGLTQRQILELMRTVCEAVQHAHERGVIHRDLKPSNILVTADGQPHVLDFGLAKGFLEGDSILTVSAEGEAPGTPAYMSPEQAAGKLDRIDTRSDVYALGVVLFRLVTGESPHDLSGTRYEVLRRIAEEEVRRPRQITKDVDRELEALLLKALPHDPKERYASAGALAQDVGNYLTGEPLTARSHTTIYFLRKRLRKYRGRVAIAFSVLAAFVTVALFAHVRVVRARDKLQREADKASAVADFMRGILNFGHTDPLWTRRVDRITEETGLKFARDPEVEAAVRMEIGNLHTISRQFEAAEKEIRLAVGARRNVLGEEHPDTLESMQMLAAACWNRGMLDEAEAIDRQILSVRRRLMGEEHPDTLWSMFNLVFVLWKRGKVEEAEAMSREYLEIHERIGAKHSRESFSAMNTVGTALWRKGMLDGAAKEFRRGLQVREQVLGEEHWATLDAMRHLAFFLERAGKLDEAVAMLKRNMKIRQRVFGEDDGDTLASMNYLAAALRRGDKSVEAEAVNRELFKIRERFFGIQHPDTLATMSNLASVLDEEGKLGESLALRSKEFEIRKGLFERNRARTRPATWLITRTDEARERGATVRGCEAKAEAGSPNLGALQRRASAYEGFNAKLNLDWEARNSDPTHASLVRDPGRLTITTQGGSFLNSNTDYENLFLIDCPTTPDEDFQLTTCLSLFEPVTDMNQAGLVFYNDDDDYLSFTYRWDNISGGRVFEVVIENEGRPASVLFFSLEEAKSIWLRVTKRANRYSFSTSVDGRTFVSRNHPEHDYTGLFQDSLTWGDGAVGSVGLFANNGSGTGAPEIDASFDSFEVRLLGGEVEPEQGIAAAVEKKSNVETP